MDPVVAAMIVFGGGSLAVLVLACVVMAGSAPAGDRRPARRDGRGLP